MRGQNNTTIDSSRQVVPLVVIAAGVTLIPLLLPYWHVLTRPVVALLVGLGSLLWTWVFLRLMPVRGLIAGGTNGTGRRSVLGLIFTVHVLATLFFFSPADIVNDRPVVTLDHPFHFYQASRAGDVFFKTGRLHCYDPYYMAGYPTVVFDLDMKVAELLCAPFFPVGTNRALKIFILLCYLSLVLTVFLGSRYAGFSFAESVLGLAILLVIWHWGRPLSSHFRMAGMFAFVLASHLSLLVAGLFRQFLMGRKLMGFFVIGPLAFLVHPTAVVILAVPFLILIVVDHANLTLRRAGGFLVWCLAVVVVNAVWIVPLLRYADIRTASNSYFQTEGLRGLVSVLITTSTIPALGLMGLSILGAFALHASGRKEQWFFSLGTGSVLIVLSAFGIYIPGVDNLEPGRFLFTGLIFLTPAAGAGLLLVFRRLYHSAVPRLFRTIPRAAFAMLVAGQILLAWLAATSFYKHRLSTTPPEAVTNLIAVLARYTDPSGRLMIEDGPARMYGGGHIPGILALYTRVEQIGGPYPHTFVRHHFATFQRDRTMGVPVGELTAEDFWAYVELYNILWVVTASPETNAYMARFESPTPGRPLLERLEEIGLYTLWRIDRRPSFASDGDTHVEASLNRIVVRPSRSTMPVLIKYHWDKGLKVNRPAEIRARFELNDPIPFILLDPHGAEEVVITY